MILAEKIIQLRKRLGWSQEELADKMNVSRQSVSKWESSHSIPDLNKILILAEIFGVTTDFLLKDQHETIDKDTLTDQENSKQIGLEQANKYIESKVAISELNTKGAILCICSPIPLFFLLALAETGIFGVTDKLAPAIGIVSVLLIVALSVNFFVKTNQYDENIEFIDKEQFELAYGVHSAINQQLKLYRPIYNSRTALGSFFFIACSVPLLLTSILIDSDILPLLMLIVLLLMISIGVYIVSSSSTKFDAYNRILQEGSGKSQNSKRTKRAEKIAAFYLIPIV
ncbi:XRE family transcriptional regulator [Parashewanella curva]|uniref:XRE family transcriptional regulator n=1 Tax=Parashewanella curva TaxID=2338552 RepID=A0A3L8PWM0_9GAMM|nr:helix-turn-helix transcriptional regulator [Parashewanella curva]RLV58838.1 XRE family transcriptional regulator [Parashewanella curva]